MCTIVNSALVELHCVTIGSLYSLGLSASITVWLVGMFGYGKNL